jgi:hypothetical protein
MNKTAGGIPEYELAVCFNAFGETGVLFPVSFEAQQWNSRYPGEA